MNNELVVWGLLALALAGANVPFIVNRLWLVLTPKSGSKKPIWMRLLEWLVLYFVVGGIAIMLELKSDGQVHTQDWEFYAITFFMFMVLAIPGFIYRYTFVKS